MQPGSSQRAPLCAQEIGGIRVRSIFERALGQDFNRLHPQIQKRFGFNSTDCVASIGQGVMDEVWHGRFYTLPFLYIGTWRRIMFPEQGRSIPFTIQNYAYTDRFGRETVTWIREYKTRHPRRFDAYMIYSQERSCIVDYMGTHQHLAVDLNLWVDEQGGLRLKSGEQRFYESKIAFKFPLLFSGVAEVREWYDDVKVKFGIRVRVTNKIWGPLFGYNGWFDVSWKEVTGSQIPADVLPARQESRE
jgi:hypothetical protein